MINSKFQNCINILRVTNNFQDQKVLSKVFNKGKTKMSLMSISLMSDDKHWEVNLGNFGGNFAPDKF